MTRLPERLPTALSDRIAGASGAVFARMGSEVDVAIGGIPFRLATSGEIPQSIETIPIRKEQFDAETDPGEQSLTGWWRRSQASFHYGAGYLYEPTSNQEHLGFWDSEGVNVFEPGQVTLLPSVAAMSTTVGFSKIRPYTVSAVRTNLTTNPSVETDLTGWTAGGSLPPTITRDTGQFYVGTASVKAVWQTAGTLPQVSLPEPTWTIGSTYTVSVYVYVPTGSVAVSVFVADGWSSNSSVNDQWVRISRTFTATATNHDIQIWPATPPTAGQIVYIDALLVEEGPVLGPYFDGNSTNSAGLTHAWTGVTNLSSSTQTIADATAKFSAVKGGTFWTGGVAGTTMPTSLHAPGGKTIVDGVVSGASFYDVASDGSLYEGLLSSPGTATTWPLTGGGSTRLGWGKHRLWVIGGRRLWQPNLSSAGGTAQSPIFTHPNQGWQYTCMAEGSTAMYFGGHDGNASSVQAITLDSGGGLPTLSGATVTAALPDGELVQELSVVAGQFLGIGTNRGFRIGKIQPDASLHYGPLIIEPEGVLSCTALIAQGRFFVVGFNTAAEGAVTYRIDTSLELSEGVFPYAKDMRCNPAGAVIGLVALSTSRLLAVTAEGIIYAESTTSKISEGWIQSSRIRYRTTEPKSFKYLDLDIEPLTGNIGVDLILEGGSTLPVGNLTQQGEVMTDSFSVDVAPMRYVSLLLTLTPTGGVGPTVSSFLLRALPAPRPQRLITLPLLCFDSETGHTGQRYGADGYALDRRTALELLEDTASSVVYQDFTIEGSPGRIVTIDSARFVQTSPSKGNPGGILIVQLRTVD